MRNLLEYHAALDEGTNASLKSFLLNDVRDEEIAFATWNPAQGLTRLTALIHNPIFPKDGDRERHGNVSALPQYVDRAKETARVNGEGLAMIHTHTIGKGWPGLSDDDLYYERDVLAREVFGVTGYPLVGMTLSVDGIWSARIYPKESGRAPVLAWCDAVRIVGKNLTIQYNDNQRPLVEPGEPLLRTTSVWGRQNQQTIMRMRVGIVGTGSVGSAVAETLSRMGVGETYLLDYDMVKEHNLDRDLYATKSDIGRLKAEMVKEHSEASATNPNFKCQAFTSTSIVEREGFDLGKDCDVLFSCVDRPWPRQVMNHLAYSCLIPVIDGGVSFKLNGTRLIHGMFRAQTVGPGRACLDCLGAYDPAEIQLDREGKFDDPVYIEQLEKAGRAPSRQNVMPFSLGLAALETIQFAELVTNLGRRGDLGQQAYDYRMGEILPDHRQCQSECQYVKMVSLGDKKPPYLAEDISKRRAMEGRSRGVD